MNINRRMKALEELFGTNDGNAEEIDAYREQLISEARVMGGPTYGNPRWIEWWREQLTPQRIREIMALRRQADAEITEEEKAKIIQIAREGWEQRNQAKGERRP
jgi:hypothetical protein